MDYRDGSERNGAGGFTGYNDVQRWLSVFGQAKVGWIEDAGDDCDKDGDVLVWEERRRRVGW